MIAIAVIVPLVMSVPMFGRSWNMFLHTFGAILFLGNIAVTAVWASLARRDGSPGAVRLASRAIVVTDLIFTTPGAIFLLANGGILGTPYFKAASPWLIVSVALFVFSGVIWLALMVPLQKRLLDVAYTPGDDIPDEWHTLIRQWFRMGGIATLLPLITLVLMVAKPTFW
jgi:uncharacterized membrane protein